MKLRNKGMIAYGTPEDREKLAALADLYGISGSELIIKMIRDRFEDLFHNKPSLIQISENVS